MGALTAYHPRIEGLERFDEAVVYVILSLDSSIPVAQLGKPHGFGMNIVVISQPEER